MSELKEPLRRLLLKQEHLSVLIRQVENMAMAVEHQGIVDSNSDFGLLSAIESGKRFRFMEECLRVEFDFVTSQIERLHADLRDSESREGEEIWLDSGTETQVPVLGSVMDAQTYTNMGPETEAMDTGKSKQQEQEMTAEELSAFFGSSTEAGGQEEQAQAHHLEQQMGGMFQVARMAAGRPLCPNLNTRERDKVGDQVSGEMEMSELKRRLGRFMLMHKRLDMLLCQVKKMSATIKQASVGSKLDPTFFNHDFCARKKCRLMEHSLRTEIDAVLLRIGRLHVQIGEKTRKLHICDSETREGEEIWFDSGTETQVPVLGSAMDAQTYTDMGSETEAMDTGKSAMKQHEEMITEELFACFMSWIEGGGEEKVEVEEGVEENKEQAMEKQQEQEMTTQELFACFGSWTEGGGEEEVVVEQEVEKDKEQAMEKQQEQEMTTEELFACYVSWTEAGDQEDVEVEEGVQVEQEQEEHEEEQEMEVTMEERSKSAMEGQDKYLTEEEDFDSYRAGWEITMAQLWRSSFTDLTTLSPMHFTHLVSSSIPRRHACTGETLQIFSIKIAELKGSFQWPLDVYGVVAARDFVDNNRNLLFYRTRSSSQRLTEDDPFLCLTGPSRAVVSMYDVDFEIQLRVKGRKVSQDKPLISLHSCYRGNYTGFHTFHFRGRFCRTELNLEQLEETVQATMLGVRVVKGESCPFKYGGRVACFSPAQEVMVIDNEGTVMEVTDPPQSRQVVLLDSKDVDSSDQAMPKGSDGYLHLSRHVFSVQLRRVSSNLAEFEESLKVVIQAYSPSGDIAAQGHVYFKPKYWNISQHICNLGDSEVEITVAWSLLVQEKYKIVAGRAIG